MEMIGWQDTLQADNKGLMPHLHGDAYAVCFMRRCTNSWDAEGKQYSLEPNDIYITWPHELHGGTQERMLKSEIF